MSAASSQTRLSDAQFERLRDLVRARIGMEIPSLRRRDLEAAVHDALEATGLHGVEALCRRLETPSGAPDPLAPMIPKLTVGETHFFRNSAQMHALEQTILPELIERRRHARRLRIWSAGCSTGEEPYSLAILLDRLLSDRERWQVTIRATDVNPQALAKAARGVYGSWSFREVPSEVKVRYFRSEADKLVLDERIRAMVTFAEHNLVHGTAPAGDLEHMDLVVCRNVLIYFGPETSRAVVARLRDALVPGGWLVVGHVEPSQDVFGDFLVRNLPQTIAYQRPESGAASPAQPPARPPRPLAARSLAARPVKRSEPPAVARGKPVRPPQPGRPGEPRRSAGEGRPPQPARSADAARSPFEVAMRALGEGRSDQALALLEDAASTDPRAAYEVAKLRASRLELDAAEQWIEIAVQGAPMVASAHYLKGVVLQERGDLAGALESLRRCLYVDPAFALGHVAIAALYSRLDQQPRARKALEAASALLGGRERDELVPEGDGLTYGRLAELVRHKQETVAR